MNKLILSLFCTLVVFTCSKQSTEKNEGPRIYKVATDATWPPMEFLTEDKELVGFSIDVMNAVAKEAGFEVQIRNTAWDGIFAGLANNNYDMVISSVTITEERQAKMDFSIPYVNAGQVLVVRKETEERKSLADFAPGTIMGAQIGTTGAFAIGDVDHLVLKSYDELGFAVADLVNGKIDGVVADTPIAAEYVLNNPEYKEVLKISGEPFTEEYYGIAVKKGNQELLDLINTGLQMIQVSGELERITEKWLG